ncbi:MAG TPA: helix-turn-helix domain-containing protein [Streptosporangiaceae bacterium]|nr:helix-turn-helix domain-containing protein [Streptosporangiaceae bacterium]
MVAERLLATEAREEGLASPSRGGSRAAILHMLRSEARPLGIREVAGRTGLHQNTARFHLEALVAAGLAARETEDRDTPGRPRIGYRAVAGGPGERREYRLLSVMLASLIAGTMPEPAAAAEAAGREWGAYLAEKTPPFQRLSAEEALAKLTGIMAELGFEPHAVTGADTGGQYRLELRQCPFLEVARQHRDVICALHLGLMRGALDLMRAPVTADELTPFAEPGLCVARLTAHDGDR